ncbi:BNR-4 repeat-containing protein [Sphingosinicella rhizophila]|uniref:BNR-4 repeat-containing protein n=1 Tax=Sphingosinicella rhizophila TaxID=3050082 RepID=A0ABU3Q543_9SPHN|nr:BNR-4 repeat-containing protein [Sphingosinicella sp. GR2756]MDT9598530.1 BNR-4 repeat-containing protein [Sphingosinicella sp. GR2756]
MKYGEPPFRRMGLGMPPLAMGLSRQGGGLDPVILFSDGSTGFLFDFQNLSTMYSDTDGTTLAVVDGPVGKVMDLSGNDNHATAPSDAERPTLKLTAIPELHPGFYYLQFNGAQRLALPAAASLYSASGAATICAAIQAAPQTDKTLYGEANSSGLNTIYVLLATGTATTSGAAATDNSKLRATIRSDVSSQAQVESALVALDNLPRIVTQVDSSRTFSKYVGDQLDSVGGSYGGTFTLNTVTIGALSRSTGLGFFTGRLYAIMGVRKVLSAGQISQVQSWMTSKCRTPKREVSGAWTFFTDPRALSVAGKQIIGGVSPIGVSVVADASSARFAGVTHPLCRFASADDHNNFGFVELTNGKILAIGTGHSVDTYYTRISANAADVKTWGSLTDIAAQFGTTNMTYANPVRLSDGIYNFFRGTSTDTDISMHMTNSTDEAVTWATATKITTGSRPYFRVVGDGNDTVYFVTNDGHPGDASLNSLYAFKMVGGSFFEMDDTPLTLPITPSADLTPIWDATAEDEDSWCWDIAIDPATGDVVIVYAVFPTPASDHRYRYARWNGSAWSDNQICTAGGPMYAAETHYSGGVCLDHNDPNVVFASRETAGLYKISRLATQDDGASFSEAVITGGADDCYRPSIVRGATAEPRLVYMRGTYTTYANFATRVLLVNSLTGAL